MATRVPLVLPLLAAAGTVTFWSSSFPAISYGLQVFSPPQLALLRFAIALLILAVPVAAGAIRLPPLRDWPVVALLGVLGITVYQLSLGYAMTRISAAAAAVIVALVPGITSALAAWRLGESIGKRALAGLAIAFVGVILVTLGTRQAVRFEPMALLVAVSVLAISIYFVWQKPLLARTTPAGFTTLSIFAGTLGLLPFGFDLPARIAIVPPAQLDAVVYLAIAPTILGYIGWNWALSHAPTSTVSSFLYAQPMIASAMAWIWLGQTPSALTIAGGALAVGGVIVTLRGAPTPALAPTSRLTSKPKRASTGETACSVKCAEGY